MITGLKVFAPQGFTETTQQRMVWLNHHDAVWELYETTTTPRLLDSRNAGNRYDLVIAAMILTMVIVGGITRLTESGLSITEWKPVTGAIPPLSDAQWAAEFDRYKHSSQYVLMNEGMTLAAFKHIYFWEIGRAHV